ncbi:MAG: type 4a pilus biogenesis protein PilO [Desulfobacteraceae bacterium]|nr:type 4a pilus biogenesis protein PilO [Desulfobacteraceae bacterium]
MKKVKIIIYICVFAILCNIAVKFFIIGNQSKYISFLQKKAVAVRSDTSSAFERSERQISKQYNDIKKIMNEIPQEFSFSEYAVKVRSLIDMNQLFIEDSLVFSPEETQNPSLLVYNTNIIVTGKYPAIKQFISDIQNLKGLKYLNSVSMIRDSKHRERIKLSLRLSVFLRKGTV